MGISQSVGSHRDANEATDRGVELIVNIKMEIYESCSFYASVRVATSDTGLCCISRQLAHNLPHIRKVETE